MSASLQSANHVGRTRWSLATGSRRGSWRSARVILGRRVMPLCARPDAVGRPDSQGGRIYSPRREHGPRPSFNRRIQPLRASRVVPRLNGPAGWSCSAGPRAVNVQLGSALHPPTLWFADGTLFLRPHEGTPYRTRTLFLLRLQPYTSRLAPSNRTLHHVRPQDEIGISRPS